MADPVQHTKNGLKKIIYVCSDFAGGNQDNMKAVQGGNCIKLLFSFHCTDEKQNSIDICFRSRKLYVF